MCYSGPRRTELKSAGFKTLLQLLMTKLKKNKDEDNEVVELAFEAGVCETTKTGYTSCPLHF